MKNLIASKLKIARKSLNMSQEDFADAIGYNQSGISAIETGTATFVPNLYLEVLASRGVNLTGIFNESVSPDQYADMCFGNVPAARLGPCPNCAAKDQIIADKNEIIAGKNEVIEMLREKLKAT